VLNIKLQRGNYEVECWRIMRMWSIGDVVLVGDVKTRGFG
jgi:hypothetical protein